MAARLIVHVCRDRQWPRLNANIKSIQMHEKEQDVRGQLPSNALKEADDERVNLQDLITAQSHNETRLQRLTPHVIDRTRRLHVLMAQQQTYCTHAHTHRIHCNIHQLSTEKT